MRHASRAVGAWYGRRQRCAAGGTPLDVASVSAFGKSLLTHCGRLWLGCSHSCVSEKTAWLRGMVATRTPGCSLAV